MNWHYKDLGLTRQEAEDKVKSLKFLDAENRGWYRMLKKKNNKKSNRRIHIVPSDTYFNIHIDSATHKVVCGERELYIINLFMHKLNKFSFKWKIKLLFRRFDKLIKNLKTL